MDESRSLEAVLKPFDDGRLAGDDLRLDVSPESLYFRLRDARSEARAAERQADNDPSLGGNLPAQWATVHDLAYEALVSRSKDVEIACWLTEALTRHRGLAGLAAGANIISGLITDYWSSGLYPTLDEDDPEGRLISITGMSGQDRDGSLLQPLRKIVLFVRPDGAPVAFWQFDRAREVSATGGAPEKAQHAVASPALLDLEAEARGAGQASLLTIRQDAVCAGDAWRALEETVARIPQGDAVPSTGRVRGMIESVRRLAERYLPAEQAGADQPPDATASDPSASSADAPSAIDALVPVPRDAMLDEILRIASFFRQKEPNSPLSFTLEEAVRRARMPWPDLLRELLPDLNARQAVLASAGTKPVLE